MVIAVIAVLKNKPKNGSWPLVISREPLVACRARSYKFQLPFLT